jgi:hypothetical protein
MAKTFEEIINADVFDIRDVIERFEELESIQSGYDNPANFETNEPDSAAEFNAIESFLSDVKGKGGDEDFRGNWYPVGFIEDSYFETAMDEMLEDIGEMPKYQDIPSYLTITVNYIALQQDYSSIEINGKTYWYR